MRLVPPPSRSHEPSDEVAKIGDAENFAEDRGHQGKGGNLPRCDLAFQNPVGLPGCIEEGDDLATFARDETGDDDAVGLFQCGEAKMGVDIPIRIEDVLCEAGEPARSDPVELRADEPPFAVDAMTGAAMGGKETFPSLGIDLGRVMGSDAGGDDSVEAGTLLGRDLERRGRRKLGEVGLQLIAQIDFFLRSRCSFFHDLSCRCFRLTLKSVVDF